MNLFCYITSHLQGTCLIASSLKGHNLICIDVTNLTMWISIISPRHLQSCLESELTASIIFALTTPSGLEHIGQDSCSWTWLKLLICRHGCCSLSLQRQRETYSPVGKIKHLFLFSDSGNTRMRIGISGWFLKLGGVNMIHWVWLVCIHCVLLCIVLCLHQISV